MKEHCCKMYDFEPDKNNPDISICKICDRKIYNCKLGNIKKK